MLLTVTGLHVQGVLLDSVDSAHEGDGLADELRQVVLAAEWVGLSVDLLHVFSLHLCHF